MGSGIYNVRRFLRRDLRRRGVIVVLPKSGRCKVTEACNVSDLRCGVALLEDELGLTEKQVIHPGAARAADLAAQESLRDTRVPSDLASKS